MSSVPSITLLIATYNRARILRQTLQALSEVDRAGIDLEVIIIDNNSSDDTTDAAVEYRGHLPLRVLKETRAGKNCALNRALREIALKDIVLFADDDVVPAHNWLKEVVGSTLRWPDIAVFGGGVEVGWPEDRQPEWAEAEWVRAIGFSWHRYADQEVFYVPPACPFGPNYWVRKSVFQKVPSFDETIGPRPVGRIMGSETSFLRQLQIEGFRMVHCPTAVVKHQIEKQQCSVEALRRRGYTFGRGQTRLHGWYRRDLFARNRMLWGMMLSADCLYAVGRYCIGRVVKDPRTNCEMTVSAMIRLGELRETTFQVLRHYGWTADGWRVTSLS
jgi:glycosyltransferase involved in cell wall biosynthesis